MGGDVGPRLVVPSVLSVLERFPRLRCRLFGDEAVVAPLMASAPSSMSARATVVHCSQQVGMDDKPAHALRHKRDSSMWRAIAAVAQGEAQACVSAGNTGALMAMGMIQIGTLPGIERPAICTAVPTAKGKAYLLDMGANIGCDARQLLQFAYMASAMVESVESLPTPRIGLLNVGREAGKGDAVVQEAAQLFHHDPHINYCGFAEGDAIFSGDFDIIVCDGFAGNVALKSTEGAARMIVGRLREEFSTSWGAKLAALIARPSLLRLQKMLDPANYNGANLLGLEGTVIKSHGGATREGFVNALEVAIFETDKQIPQRISDKLARMSVAAPIDGKGD